MTALAALALQTTASAGDSAAQAALDRAVGWLEANKTDDLPQSIALRLVLWRRLGRPVQEWQPLVAKIKTRQNDAGGWGQD